MLQGSGERVRLLAINNEGATFCQRGCCEKQAMVLPAAVAKLPTMFPARTDMILFFSTTGYKRMMVVICLLRSFLFSLGGAIVKLGKPIGQLG
jgi:hypothetical protein